MCLWDCTWILTNNVSELNNFNNNICSTNMMFDAYYVKIHNSKTCKTVKHLCVLKFVFLFTNILLYMFNFPICNI